MKKEVIVISLGGSLIIPDEVDVSYLKKLKVVLKKHLKNYDLIVVCGGGSIARKYISALREMKLSEHIQGLAGISATRMNARFMSYFFGFEPDYGAPQSIRQIKKQLRKRGIVFSGSLNYKTNQTSDSDAVLLAKYFNCKFVNLTNVQGLYDKDPNKFKTAKLISRISWKDFSKMANKNAFKPGQHFVLDQKSSKIIMENKIPAYIVGKDVKELDNFLKGENFRGTVIEG